MLSSFYYSVNRIGKKLKGMEGFNHFLSIARYTKMLVGKELIIDCW